MARSARLFVAFILFGAGFLTLSRGALVSYKDLSVAQESALQQSEHRLLIYDRALKALDDTRAHHRISSQEFTYKNRDLVGFIGAEARFQNDLLTKNSGFAEDSREVMQNIAKYAVEVPLYILAIAAGGLRGSSFSFSP